MTWTRRSFLSASACGGLAAASWPLDLAQAAQVANAVDVRRFGATGDGIRDDTRAIAAALSASPAIYVPAGTYRVERIMVPGGRTILTDGFRTLIRQRPGTDPSQSVVRVVGSNVRIGAFSVEGNIRTDTLEFHYGLHIRADDTTGNLSDIVVDNVRGVNLRGDVVCIDNRDGGFVSGVRIGHVHGTNILRNVVSIVGGRDLHIERITGSAVGYTHFDIEPEDFNGPVVGVTVGSVLGGIVQVAGSTPHAYVDQVRIGLLDLSPPPRRSVPIYPPGLRRKDGLTVRNIRSLEIGHLIARDFEGRAIYQIWDPGALTDQRLHISAAELSNCARDPRLGNAFITGSRFATRLRIDDLTVDRIRAGVNVVRDCKEARIGRLRKALPKGNRLVSDSGPELDKLLYLAGGGAVALGACRMVRNFRATA